MKFKIKDAREAAGYSQKELAKLIGVAPSTFNGYESGNHDPKSDLLLKIADACNVTVDFLLGRIEAKENSPSAAEAAPGEETVSVEEVKDVLLSLGFIKEGQDLSDRDLAFIDHVIGLLDAWFSENP